MNTVLMENITQHILANLGVLPLSFIDMKHTQSLMDKEFLLNQKLAFKNEDGKFIYNNIYGCQVIVGQKEFKILLGDCSQDKATPEFCVVVQLTGNPAYGLYLVCDPSLDNEALIAVSVNDKEWMPCNTFLQATFLAAMEQLKDLGLGWIKCNNYRQHYDILLSMIKFHTAYYEVKNEGQEV